MEMKGEREMEMTGEEKKETWLMKDPRERQNKIILFVYNI